MLFLSVLVFIAAIPVNLFLDKKKNNSMLTSIIALVALLFAFVYIVGYWIGDNSKLVRDAEDLPGISLSGAVKFGRILYWFVIITSIAGGLIPALMGGFIGK